ncbi:DUF4212 domain-containing protein [Nesterenkonia sp. NBAIMH1]|uniref:DUF4212 domain-containing protein n=1 Tax=Nesterenkonia sp. NBAIMH1 TaxID=2600320 RepID=UPI0011B74392|nr:DUF4212 domain-containing protein [Nesterenkonia sp. NBAIMH1]
MSDVDQHQEAGSPPPDLSWRKRYWKKNVRVLVVLLSIWAFVSLGLSVLLIEPLNNFEILGFPLGLWFAHQGSIITFILITLVYAVWMDRIDSEFGVSEKPGGDKA